MRAPLRSGPLHALRRAMPAALTPSSSRRRRLDAVETACVGTLLVAIAALTTHARDLRFMRTALVFDAEGACERGKLEQKYGPSKSSQFDEEWIVRDFFQDRRGGTFVDVGAN